MNTIKTRTLYFLAILLFSGMLAICFVFVHMWQQSIVRSGLNTNITFIVNTYLHNSQKNFGEPSTAEIICKSIGKTCVKYTAYQNEQKTGKPESDDALKLNMRKLKLNEDVRQYIKSIEREHKGIYTITFDFGKADMLRVKLDFRDMFKDIHDAIPILVFYIVLNTVFLSTIGFFRLVRTVFKPIDNMVELSEKFFISDYDTIEKLPAGSAFSQVSYSLQSMLNKIKSDKAVLRSNLQKLEETNKQLLASQNVIIRSEKLAAVGRLAAGLAHEIGNPLGIIQGYIDLIEEETDADLKKQYCQRAMSEISRIDRLIRKLLDYSRRSSSSTEKLSPQSVIEDLIDLVKVQNDAKEIIFSLYTKEEDVVISVNYDDIYQVVMNCLLNSIDAINAKSSNKQGEIRISISAIESTNDEAMVEIEIKDNGVGIHQDQIDTIFDPFFTTKDVGQGTGLGLAVTQAMIERYGGSIGVESEYLKGTTLRIRLPRTH